MKVHLLVTYRRAELLRASTMVFDSIRQGFPQAQIVAQLNEAEDGEAGLDWSPIYEACKRARVEVAAVRTQTIHHEWILGLLDRETEPFFICDTDLVFFDELEGMDMFGAALAGRFIPQFFDAFTNCITRPRLHTSLLYFHPRRIREETEKYFAQFPETRFNPRPNLIYPGYLPQRSESGLTVKNFFHDTASLLYQAIGGTRFTPELLDRFGHLNFGTISDMVAPAYPQYPWRMQHFAAFDNPELLRGSWKTDDEFYRRHAA